MVSNASTSNFTQDMNTAVSLSTIVAAALLTMSAMAQVPDPLIDPPKYTATYTGDQLPYQPGSDEAYWKQGSYKPDSNYALEPDYDFRWGLSIAFGDNVGDVHPVSGVTYYGLFVQEVSTMAFAESCDGSFTWSNSFTYYEYHLVHDGNGGHLIDVFGSGYWRMGPGAAERGFVWKRGVAKFIPILDGDLDRWFAQGDSMKPPAVEAFENMESDQGWNREPEVSEVPEENGNILVLDANKEPVIASPHSKYDFYDTAAHSGSMPNRPDKPAGWDTDFGGHAQTLQREYFIWWDYCNPISEVQNGDEEQGSKGGKP